MKREYEIFAPEKLIKTSELHTMPLKVNNLNRVKLIILIVFSLSMLVISCKHKPEQNVASNSGLIEISKVQFESEKMVIGEPSLQHFAKKVHFTGTIVPSIEGQAKISLPIPGIIDKIRCKPAQKVTKGSVLFEISGHWFIDLQKDYATSSAIIAKLQNDYKRAEQLQEENIGTRKEYTAAKSSYYAENAKYEALKKQLSNMGIDVAKIEAGAFYSSFPVKSPINGYITSTNATIGQYFEPQQSIAEIIDNNSFQLKLSVFEKDLQNMETGQIVEFYFNADKTQKYNATLNAIGKTIMSGSKSIECYAKIENINNIKMVRNQFVEGDIFTSTDTIWAVPETAILESENDFYILLLEKEDNSTYYFKKEKVNTGRKSNNYVELTEQLSSEKLIQSGIYNIVIE